MKKILLFILLVAGCFSVFAQNESELNTNEKQKKSDWTFYLISDFVVPFGSSTVSSNDDDSHFAPSKGPSGFGNAETFHAECLIPTPFVKDSKNPLLSSANVKVDIGVTFAYVALIPRVIITYQPLPFISFSAGSAIGACWNFGSDGQMLGEWNASKKDYDMLTSFSHYYYDFFFTGSFMFDTGALIPGKWSHVITTASYTVLYSGLTGMGKGDIWQWQGGGSNANGFMYNANFLLGYSLPCCVKLLGVMANFNGHYNSSDYGDYSDSFNGDFVTIAINPIIELAGKKNTVDIIFNINSRRSFAQEVDGDKEMLVSTQTGREWYFNALIVSWKHIF